MALMHGGANDVNRSMTMLTSAVLQCKNALASMAAPILNVLAPALTYLINVITNVVTTIGMFIAALTGKSTFLKATKVTKNYAASLGGLEKATKKAPAAKASKKESTKDSNSDDEGFLDDDDEDSLSDIKIDEDDMDMLLNEESIQFSLEDFGMNF